jgi:hemerythrin-like metal-binding protein
MFIDWTESYRLGIPMLDDDHRKLVDLANQFFLRAQSGAAMEVLDGILEDLIDQTSRHFKQEEILLDRHGYPDLASHRGQHDRLILQMRYYLSAAREDSVVREFTVDRMEYLAHALVGHILDEDRPCRPYLKTLV